jgi:hypothetical protein
MTIETFDKIVKWVTIAAVILYLLAIVAALTSCTPMPTAQPTEPWFSTPSEATTAIFPTSGKTPTPTLTPTPTDKPNKCRIGGRRIADCIRKGINP